MTTRLPRRLATALAATALLAGAGGQAAPPSLPTPSSSATAAQVAAGMQAAAGVLTYDSPSVAQPVLQKRFLPILAGADADRAAQQARDRRQAALAAIQRYLDILRGMWPRP